MATRTAWNCKITQLFKGKLSALLLALLEEINGRVDWQSEVEEGVESEVEV
jgi:hypothetical protein